MGAAASISAPEEKKTLLAKCVEEYEAEAAKDGAQTDAILDILADKYTDIIQHVDESKWPEFSAWLAKDRQLCMPCEAIGSVPRPQAVVDALNGGETNFDSFLPHVQETVSKLLQATDNDVNVPVTDGEQTKPSFFTYPIHGMANLNPNGVQIPFVDGHVRTLPSITSGPFQYTKYAVDYLRELKKHVPPGQKVKQAVIAASGVSMLYPTDPIADYPKEQFMQDVVQEVVKDIKQCLDEGADVVQMDMTEARLSLKMDLSGGLLQMLLNVNEMVISQFSDEEKQKIGIHVCPVRLNTINNPLFVLTPSFCVHCFISLLPVSLPLVYLRAPTTTPRTARTSTTTCSSRRSSARSPAAASTCSSRASATRTTCSRSSRPTSSPTNASSSVAPTRTTPAWRRWTKWRTCSWTPPCTSPLSSWEVRPRARRQTCLCTCVCVCVFAKSPHTPSSPPPFCCSVRRLRVVSFRGRRGDVSRHCLREDPCPHRRRPQGTYLLLFAPPNYAQQALIHPARKYVIVSQASRALRKQQK